MTRIAIISDIHGNLTALDAVIADLEKRRVDEVLVAGDLVGRGPQGDAVVSRIREQGWRSVRGNHEDYLIDFRDNKVPEEWLTLKEWAAVRWMAAELSSVSLDHLRRLPFSMRSEIDAGVLVFHGSPRSNSEGLGQWSDPEMLRETLFQEDCQVMVVAHTHKTMAWRFEDRLLINVGSVGLPFNGNRAAQYAIIEKKEIAWSHEFVSVDYDFKTFENVYRDSGFLEAGGLTAHLLLEEVRNARPFLVPFQKWMELIREKESVNEMEAFLGWYDCSKPTNENVKLFHQKFSERNVK